MRQHHPSLTRLLVVLAVVAGALLPTSAHAVGTGRITGTVTGSTGAALGDAYVAALQMVVDDGWSYWDEVAWDETDAAGAYDLTGLEAGTYRLRFVDWSGDHVAEYYADQPTVQLAQDVVVGDGAVVTGKDAQLAPAGHVTGTVTGPADVPLDGVYVTVYEQVSEDGSTYWDYVREGETDASGAYDVGGLEAGTYRVGFDDYSGDHVSEYYADQPTVELAQDVVVASGATVGDLDAQLAVAGHITGTVTGPGGVAAEDVGVAVYRQVVEDGDAYWDYVSSGYTDAQGAYDAGRLPAGTFRIGFYDYTGDLLAEFYDDQATIATARDLVVAAGATLTGKDAQLAAASHVTGTVTLPGGQPAQDVWVTAYQSYTEGGATYWDEVAWDYTGSTGAYDLGGLAAGTYRVGFVDESGTYPDEYWNDKAAVEQADDVAVGAAATRSGIDAVLGLGSTTPAPTPTAPAPAPVPAPLPPAPGPVTSPAPPAPTAVLSDVAPRGTGKLVVGKKLKVSKGSWNVPVTVKYQWFANGKKIKKATKSSYKLTRTVKGRKISVKVTASAPGLTSKVVTVKFKGKVKG